MAEQDRDVRYKKILTTKIYLTHKNFQPDESYPEISPDKVMAIVHVPENVKFGIRLRNRKSLMTITTKTHELWYEHTLPEVSRKNKPTKLTIIRLIPDAVLTRTKKRQQTEQSQSYITYTPDMNKVGKN